MRIALIAIVGILGFAAGAYAAEPKSLSLDPITPEVDVRDNTSTPFEDRAFHEEGIVDLAIRNRVALTLPGDWKIVGQGSSFHPIPSSRVRTDTAFFERSIDDRTTLMIGARRMTSSQQGFPSAEASLYGIVGFARKF